MDEVQESLMQKNMIMYLASLSDINGFIASTIRRIKKKQDWVPTIEDVESLARATATLEGVGEEFLEYMKRIETE